MLICWNLLRLLPAQFFCLDVHQIITPCSLKFHNFVTYVLKIFLFGIICSSFQFISQPPVVLPASSVLKFFHFLFSSILLIISCVIHGFLALFSTFPTRSLRVFKTHSFILCHCTSTFPLSHSIAPSFPSRVFREVYQLKIYLVLWLSSNISTFQILSWRIPWGS